MLTRKLKISLLIIVAAGAVIWRLFALGRGEPISDEVFYGFRAIGYLDFDFAKYQPGILQLFNGDIPAWTKLSFSDHPPLVFVIQHLFVGLFGVSLWALRLSSALFGLAGVYLVYLIGRHIFSQIVGYLAGALMAVNVLMIYISRTGLQESQVIFLILLSVYFFLQALDKPKYWLAVGVTFGLGLLSKFTVLFLAPALLLYILIFSRHSLRERRLYWGGLVALIIFSPVIIYNLLLYKTFGHFDFQWSYFFHQTVAYWQVTPGKDIGSLADRFFGFFSNLRVYNSNVFNWLFIPAFIVFLFSLIKKNDDLKKQKVLLLSVFIFNYLFYLIIGPGLRFLAMIIPWAALIIAWFFGKLLELKFSFSRQIIWALIALIFCWEAFYSWNSFIAYRPAGREILTYSKVHWDMHSRGFNQLNEYLDNLFVGKYPALTVPYKYAFLEDIKSRAIDMAKARGDKPAKILVIYDENIYEAGVLWTLARPSLYQSWPIITLSSYEQIKTQAGPSFNEQLKGVDIYFIKPTEYTLLVDVKNRTTAGEQFSQNLNLPDEPLTIYNALDQQAFYIYHWQLK